MFSVISPTVVTTTLSVTPNRIAQLSSEKKKSLLQSFSFSHPTSYNILVRKKVKFMFLLSQQQINASAL